MELPAAPPAFGGPVNRAEDADQDQHHTAAEKNLSDRARGSFHREGDQAEPRDEEDSKKQPPAKADSTALSSAECHDLDEELLDALSPLVWTEGFLPFGIAGLLVALLSVGLAQLNVDFTTVLAVGGIAFGLLLAVFIQIAQVRLRLGAHRTAFRAIYGRLPWERA